MSAFTTLNSTSPKPTDALISTPAPHEDLPASTTPARTTNHSEVPRSHQQQSPSITRSLPQPQQASESRREPWDSPADRAYLSTTFTDVVDSTHKRKRSDSVEPPRRDLTHPAAPPAPAMTQSPSTEGATLPNLPAIAREAYNAAPAREYPDAWRYRDLPPVLPNGQTAPSSSTSQQSPLVQQSQPVATQSQTLPDDMDLIRRANSHSDPYPTQQVSPDGDDRSVYQFSPDGVRRDGGVSLSGDQKKRKRNFSNRTKTGCLTCRRRKKKCDEQKPECVNCIKGGFMCAGYQPQRGPMWSKAETKAPTPLEPKESAPYAGHVSTASYSHPPYPPPQTIPQANRNHSRGQPLRINPPQNNSIVTDDDRLTASTLASASTTSPESKLTAMSAYGNNNVFPTPISANPDPSPASFGDRLADQSYGGRPKSIYERPEPVLQTPSEAPHCPANTLPQIQIFNPTRSNSPVVTSQVSQIAQIALTQFNNQSRSRTQKEEMLAGRPFLPYDTELVEDRENCSLACWRFNNAWQPHHGIRMQERQRLFREIIQPAANGPNMQPNRAPDSIMVEGPFLCDYGYNVTIGHGVSIGKDCYLQDAAAIRIGDNCHVGPNVKVYTEDMSTDHKQRGGVSTATRFGKAVTIEADCYIGGGVTICPGVVVGRGSSVGAGSVVVKNVPPGTVVSGNPAEVVRGVSA